MGTPHVSSASLLLFSLSRPPPYFPRPSTVLPFRPSYALSSHRLRPSPYRHSTLPPALRHPRIAQSPPSCFDLSLFHGSKGPRVTKGRAEGGGRCLPPLARRCGHAPRPPFDRLRPSTRCNRLRRPWTVSSCGTPSRGLPRSIIVFREACVAAANSYQTPLRFFGCGLSIRAKVVSYVLGPLCFSSMSEHVCDFIALGGLWHERGKF